MDVDLEGTKLASLDQHLQILLHRQLVVGQVCRQLSLWSPGFVEPDGESLLKGGLLRWVCLRMSRTGHQFTPLLPFQLTVDGRGVYCLSDLLLKRLLDQGNRAEMSCYCWFAKRTEKVNFGLPTQVTTAPSPFAWSLNCCYPKAVLLSRT